MLERQPLAGERAQLDQQLLVVEFAQQQVEARAARSVGAVAPAALAVSDSFSSLTPLAGSPGRRSAVADQTRRYARRAGQRPAVAAAQHRRADQRAQRRGLPGARHRIARPRAGAVDLVDRRRQRQLAAHLRARDTPGRRSCASRARSRRRRRTRRSRPDRSGSAARAGSRRARRRSCRPGTRTGCRAGSVSARWISSLPVGRPSM